MNRNLVQAVALGLSAIACCLAAAAFLRSGQPPALAGEKTDPTAERVQELEKQTAALRSDLDRLANAPRDVSAGREPASVPPDLLKRLDDLEKSVAGLQRPSKEGAIPAKAAPVDSPDLAKLQRQATDPSATEQEKLAALRALRGQKLDGREAISPDVVLAMLDLAERSQDERTRLDVYRNLHGVKDPGLRNSMLRALASDPSAKVREKVAQDIDTFLPDATVEGALQQAADGDPDVGVRTAAQKTLAGRR